MPQHKAVLTRASLSSNEILTIQIDNLKIVIVHCDSQCNACRESKAIAQYDQSPGKSRSWEATPWSESLELAWSSMGSVEEEPVVEWFTVSRWPFSLTCLYPMCTVQYAGTNGRILRQHSLTIQRKHEMLTERLTIQKKAMQKMTLNIDNPTS